MITTKCLKIEIIIIRHKKRLAKFALIKYHINFRKYGMADTPDSAVENIIE